MGYNAREDAVLHTLQSLETVLRMQGFSVPTGSGVDVAISVYDKVRNTGSVNE
jgi:(S)-ureidoglycine-glyoxylate aminotransferase